MIQEGGPGLRKYIGVALALLVLASLTFAASCRPRTYTDGTYQAVSQADAHGYAWAKVTIAKDKITAVELKEITELGVEKDVGTYPQATPTATASSGLPFRTMRSLMSTWTKSSPTPKAGTN